MLSKQYRLKKKYQFNYVYRVGKTVSSKSIVLYYSPSRNKNVKVGISVSKKIGHAITRNLIKRRIREAIYPLLENINPNFNIVIVAKTKITEIKFDQIKTELEYLLKKATLI